jgi:general secretion pathway protein E
MPTSAPLDPRSADFARKLSAFLVEGEVLDELSASRGLRAQRDAGERFDLVLVRLGLVTELAMAQRLAEFCGMPFVSSAAFPTSAAVGDDVNAAYLKQARILPIADVGDHIAVAVADPFNREPADALAYQLGRPVERHLAVASDIDAAIERLYGVTDKPGTITTGKQATEAAANDDDVQRLQDMASEAPIIRLVQDLIVRAVGSLASDIHIEPAEDNVRVRYRIDGVLHTVQNLATDVRAGLCSRVKIMARLNIAERRLPQDGRAKVNVRGREIDLRVSTMPTMWGESVVLRILDRSSIELDFAKLGFATSDVAALTQLLEQPNGIILVTGPTGSGKTTTLYTALSALNSTERKIFTVEDPIEYQLTGINQIQVQPRIGLTFATALRSILRQDPDIIMLGEIRDLETAQIAIQASLTGHLVLSTVHTNSAVATIARLLDMGIENYLLASCLKGVLAQRLVRKLCQSCATLVDDHEASAATIPKAFGSDTSMPRSPLYLRKAVGCPVCRQSGFSGRTTIYELLTMTPQLQDAMLSGQSETKILKFASEGGMVPMLDNGLAKVFAGETIPEEVYRVTQQDRCPISPTEPTISAGS